MKKLAIYIFLFLSSLAAFAQQYDLPIRNGRLVDGTGNPWVSADIGITGDRITFVGHAPSQATAKRSIDAKGLVLAPGFIDMLEQSEWNLLIAVSSEPRPSPRSNCDGYTANPEELTSRISCSSTTSHWSNVWVFIQ